MRRNSAWMLASRAARTVVAAAYFALLARSLGVSGYGAFSGACAMAGILAPFSSLGTGNLLIKSVARDHKQFPSCWRNCLLTTCVSGAVFIGIAMVIAHFLLPRSLPATLILFIAIAELFFARLIDTAGMAFQAIEQLHMTAWLSLGLSLSRLIAAAILLSLFRQPTPKDWAALYLLSTVVTAVGALCAVTTLIGLPRLNFSRHPKDILEGLYFSISLSSQSLYNDIDKTMLARLNGLGATGIYSAAYRIVDAAFSPVAAVLAATYAKFFQHGERGLDHAASFAGRVLGRAVAYSLTACFAVWMGAPFVVSILGKQYSDSVLALRMLSPLILLRSLHCFAADSLTGAGFQEVRTAVQVVVALLNIALNVVVLPRYSWRGAVWTSLACDGMLALLLWLAVWILCARARHRKKAEPLHCTMAVQP